MAFRRRRSFRGARRSFGGGRRRSRGGRRSAGLRGRSLRIGHRM